MKKKKKDENKFDLDDIVIGDPDEDTNDGNDDKDLPIPDDGDGDDTPPPGNDGGGDDDDDDRDDDDHDEDDDADDHDADDDDSGEGEGDDEDVDDSPVVTILADSGYEFTDEELEGIDDSTESLDKAVNLIATKRAEEQFNEEFGQFDDVKEYLQFRKNGGNPEDYFTTRSQEISVENLELTEDDVTTQRNIVRENLKAQGYEDKAIEEEISELEESDKLFARATRNLDVMKQNAKNQREQLLEQQTEQQKELVQEFNKVKTEASDLAKTSKLPIKLDDDIADYLYGEDPTEPSPYMADANELNQEQMLLIAQLVRNGMDLSKLVKNEAKTVNAKSLREKLRKNRAKSGNKPESTDDKFVIPDVSELKD